jgi:hypothetical protein
VDQDNDQDSSILLQTRAIIISTTCRAVMVVESMLIASLAGLSGAMSRLLSF